MKRISLVYSTKISLLGPLLVAAILIAGLTMEWFTERYPLSHAHWDSSIYLYGAKRYSEKDYLTNLREQAQPMHDCLMQGGYPCWSGGASYWSFSRLGHYMLVGTLVSLTGSDEQSIYVVTWAYRLFFAVGLFITVMLVIELMRVQRQRPNIPEHVLYLGAGLSLALYLLSDIASYMSGSLVSEIPAILLLSASIWALGRAWNRQSILYASLSGVLAFALFVVRMETIGIYLAFLIAVVFMLITRQLDGRGKWSVLITAAFTALLLFLIYSWIFYPLTDPDVVTRFRASAGAFHHPDTGLDVQTGFARFSPLIAANPLLWIGSILALPLIRTHKIARLGLIWLLLLLLSGIVGTGGETRRLAPYILPLFILSTLGWSNLVYGVSLGKSKLRLLAILCMCGVLVMVSQPVTYTYLKTLPGMWRLQFPREYLATRTFERIDYHLPELFVIHRFLDKIEQPFVLIASTGMQVADHIMVIQYLDNPSKEKDLNKKRSRENIEEQASTGLQVHLADAPERDIQFVKSIPSNQRVFLLGMSVEKEWMMDFASNGEINEALTTEHFSLAEIIVTHNPEAHSGYATFPVRTAIINRLENDWRDSTQ